MEENRKRHGCLTAWLILMLVANSGTTLMYLLGSGIIQKSLPNAPAWVFPIMAISGVFNLICAIALFKWKKWGFWGFVLSSILGAGLNFASGIGIGKTLLGLSGVLMFYGVLQIGKENKGWPQLE